MTQTVIIGGGPAGMAAAISAARVVRIRCLWSGWTGRQEAPGHRNGRCNLMNRSAPAYPGGEAFARQVLARCGEKELETFFRSLGLRLRTETWAGIPCQRTSRLRAGRPAHGPGTRRRLLRVSCPVRRLERRGERLHLSLPEETLRAARVIVTGGARRSPNWAATAPATRCSPAWGTPCGGLSPR
jgi:predicted flavoprotein YhiN